VKPPGPNHEDRKIIGEDIKDVEFSWPIGMPLVRSLGVEQGSMVLLHGFMKKSQKTRQQDIDLALKRKKGTRS
jgi:phage-related protein